MTGRLTIKTRDGDVDLKEGEFPVIPRGVEHKPVAGEEAHIMLLEKKTTISKRKVRSDGRPRKDGFEVGTFAEGKRSNLGIESRHFAPTMCVCLICPLPAFVS